MSFTAKESTPPSALVTVLKAVDRFEDQVEDRAYDELLPQHIKIALEDHVFGWTHLTSSILGHISITIVAFYMTYYCLDCRYLDLKEYRTMYQYVRICISFVMALSAYRLVRRRRYIWLPTIYGSKEYHDDKQRRRKEVAETDAWTLLGHLRRRRQDYLQRQVKRTLSEAGVVFDTFLQTTAQRKEYYTFQTFPTNETQSIGHDQVAFPEIRTMPYSHGGFFGSAPFLLANPHWICILRKLMPDVYVEISRRVLTAPAPKLVHWAENNPVVAAYGTANVLENNGKLVNLEWDVFLDPQLVRRVELVLEQLVNLSSTSDKAILDPSVVENCHQVKKFLEEELDRRSSELVDKMLIAHGNLNQLLLEQMGWAKEYNYSRVKRTRRTLGGGMYARQWMAVYAEALRLGMTHKGSSTSTSDGDAKEPQLEEEEGSVLQHQGSGTNTSRYTEDSSFMQVTTRNQTDYGSSGTYSSSCLSSLSSLVCPNTCMKESVRILKAVTKHETRPIGLVLDLKSRHVPKHIWAIVINKLTALGVHVEGVGSFCIDDVRGIGQFCHLPILEILFFHSAGDMQHAYHSGQLVEGDSVLLNGGSLIWEAPKLSNLPKVVNDIIDPTRVMQGYELLPFCEPTTSALSSCTGTVSTDSECDSCDNTESSDRSRTNTTTLAAYQKKLNLKIGLYVQEFGIDEAALGVLVNYANEHPDILSHGMVWGGLNGVTVKGIRPGRFTSTDGFHTQRYAGRSWNYAPCPSAM